MQKKYETQSLFKDIKNSNVKGISHTLMSSDKPLKFYPNVNAYQGAFSVHTKLPTNSHVYKHVVKSQKGLLESSKNKNELSNGHDNEKTLPVNNTLSDKEPNKPVADFILPWMNFITAAFVTSATILIFQSPIKTALKNYSKEKKFIPDHDGGVFGFLASLYRGTGSAFTGSTMRSGYVTATKNNKVVEEVRENEIERSSISNKITAEKIGYVGATAFGEIAVTNVSESLSSYQKGNQLPHGFDWKKNIAPLMKGGFGVRYVASATNFFSMFIIEEQIAARLPIENEVLKHVYAGAISGGLSVFFTCPIAMLNQERELRTTFTKDARLINGNTGDICREIMKQMQDDPKKGMELFVKDFSKQLPLRMVNTIIVFAIVAGLGELLGKEPFTNMIKSEPSQKLFGFFSNSDNKKADQAQHVDETPEENDNLSNKKH